MREGPFPKLANRFINCSIINNNSEVCNLIKIILKLTMEVIEGGDSAPKRMTIVKSHDVIKIVRYIPYFHLTYIIIALTTRHSM